MKQILIIILVGCSYISCTSTITTKLTQESNPNVQMLMAREQTFIKHYKLSEQLYKIIQQQHPEDVALMIEVDYELAFLKIKQKKYALAQPMFERIIEQYELGENPALPLWPYYLSKKMLDDVVLPALSPPKKKKQVKS